VQVEARLSGKNKRGVPKRERCWEENQKDQSAILGRRRRDQEFTQGRAIEAEDNTSGAAPPGRNKKKKKNRDHPGKEDQGVVDIAGGRSGEMPGRVGVNLSW